MSSESEMKGHTLDRGRLCGILRREHWAVRTRHDLMIIRLELVCLCIPVWSRGSKLVEIRADTRGLHSYLAQTIQVPISCLFMVDTCKICLSQSDLRYAEAT